MVSNSNFVSPVDVRPPVIMYARTAGNSGSAGRSAELDLLGAFGSGRFKNGLARPSEVSFTGNSHRQAVLQLRDQFWGQLRTNALHQQGDLVTDKTKVGVLCSHDPKR
jgi:hypothetical protein